MRLSLADWIVLGAYFLLSFGIAWSLRGRAQKSLADFFVAGRSVPWWIAGTSMVATTFAVDTPLWVTGTTAKYGIAGNWLWWGMLLSGMMTVFFFARLWRRSGVMTDIELVEMRYAGRPAAFLRGFRAVYLGVIMNCIIIGWVNLAMAKVFELTLGIGRIEAVILCLSLTAVYTTISGLWGVLVTDLIQFVLMMGMTIALAFYGVAAVGGLTALREKIQALEASGAVDAPILSFFPAPDSLWMPLFAFLVYIGITWWASWYPGAEPGGGGYVAQRMLSTKNEKHSLLATLWFNVAHYALRPWPWILVALASMVLYPELADKESGYIKVMVDHLPSSLRGLMLAAMLAAYMSTISTQLNWGASYVVNDFYRRFFRPGETEKHYLRAAKVATIGIMLIAAGVTYAFDTVSEGWSFLLMIGAGTGGVLLLRWYWWRINAWSEISSMIAALVISLVVKFTSPFSGGDQMVFAKTMTLTAGLCTVIWLAITLLTRPEPKEKLIAFYKKVRPARAGWGPIAKDASDVEINDSLKFNFLWWALASAMVYCILIGTGKLLLGEAEIGFVLFGGAVVCGGLLYWTLSKKGWDSVG